MSEADVVLVYPQRAPSRGRHWIMPSLGLMYLSASLRGAGYSVRHLDHTFLERREVLAEIERLNPAVVGVYSMITMQDEALSLAADLRGKRLTIVGGPYPSGDPDAFLDAFDLVAVGEGEETIVEVMRHLDDRRFEEVRGLVFRRGGEVVRTPGRPKLKELDLPLPYRDDLPNQEYIRYWRRHWKQATTPVMTTRGCPFRCEFCHKPVFGDLFRSRPAESVVEEMEQVAELGYDHVWMSDDLFTLNYRRTSELCEAIEAARLPLTWECLSRVTHVDVELFRQMRAAGCTRVFFGIESGDQEVLRQMHKGITPAQSLDAVRACVEAGVKAAGFFMVGDLGETGESLVSSINFSSLELPLDYVSYTIAYPLPGTRFYERVKERRQEGEWHRVRHNRLLFNSDFSERKLRLAIYKGAVQHRLRRLGLAPAARAFQLATDPVLRALR